MTIEYYPAFRRAVPDFEGDYLHVTHPFTTIPNEKLSTEVSRISNGTVRFAYLRHTANVHPEL